ncbi:MAG TPA: UvrB/UvrC motif-containing protein [Candidatus Paceibacterota bacterium]
MKFAYAKKENIAEIPKTTGVYSFWDKNSLLYIGKAGNLRDRVKTHFMQPSYRDNLFMDQVEKIGYVETDSEIEALLLESALIKERLPKYNVLWKDGKNYFFVLIAKEDLPRVLITHQQNQDGSYIGPFVDGKAVKRTLRSLRRIFPYYTKKHEKRLCQYCNLGLCPGPEPNAAKYKKDLKNLTSVLQGKKQNVLKKLQKEMAEAAKAQQYEKAKELRDQLHDLEVIFSHARIFRPTDPDASVGVNWPAIEKYLRRILDAKRRISRVEAYDISNMQGQEATSSMPVFVNGAPAKDQYRKFKIRLGDTPNDFAMLEETITRRLRHTEWPYPDLMIIDGGRGQLTAALRALQKSEIRSTKSETNSKLKPIAVAAIAKKHNELFLPGQSQPLLLKDMPQPVSNFILHIRDEAHRFAIGYHRLLRKKVIMPNA